jgi:hypothetical protein
MIIVQFGQVYLVYRGTGSIARKGYYTNTRKLTGNSKQFTGNSEPCPIKVIKNNSRKHNNLVKA